MGILIIFGVLGIACLILGMIIFIVIHDKKMIAVEQQKQIEIFKAAGEAEEKEKEKIARNLHDQIVAKLSATTRNFDKKISDLALLGIDTISLERDIKSMNEIIVEIRGISHDLVPGTLLQFGLIKALAYHIEAIGNIGDSWINFEDNSKYGEKIPFSTQDQLNIYRICLEILNNLIKHSSYKFLKVIVENKQANLTILFMHNGNGITDEEIERRSELPGGLGLKSLKSRTLILNAQINYFIEDDLSHVSLKIPLRK